MKRDTFDEPIKTISDLRKAIESLPDDMAVGVLYDGGRGGSYCKGFDTTERWVQDFPVFWVKDIE